MTYFGRVYWQKFDPDDFEYEFDEEELAAHEVTAEEAREVFENEFEVRRNTQHRVGYQIIGHTHGGRPLRIIVYEKWRGLLRVITGWQND